MKELIATSVLLSIVPALASAQDASRQGALQNDVLKPKTR